MSAKTSTCQAGCGSAGLAVFLFIRRTRTPSNLGNVAPLYLPAAALIAGVWLAEEGQSHRPDQALPALPADVVAALKIGEPLISDGITWNFWQNWPSELRRSECVILLRLHLDGLSEDRIAEASWRRLKLVAEDGRELTIPPGNLNRQLWRDHLHDVLTVTGFGLRSDLLSSFSLSPCRAEGVLSVTLHQRREVQIPPREAGALLERNDGALMLLDDSGLEQPDIDGQVLEFSAAWRGRDGMYPTSFWLEHPLEKERRLYLALYGQGGTSGYFMHYTREQWPVQLGQQLQAVARASVRRAARNGTLTDWRLMASWYEPEGTVELPVILEHFFVPRQPGDERKAEDIASTLRITPEMSSAKVEQTVRFALKLPSLTITIPAGTVSAARPAKANPYMASLERFLDTIPRTHLPALLNIAEQDQPAAGSSEPPWDSLFQSRIASLMDADSARQLRDSRPKAFRYVKSELARRGLIAAEEAHRSSDDSMSDEALLAKWRSQEGKYATTPFLVSGPLVEALERGLPWAATELAELADLVPECLSPTGLLPTLSKLSDCPADYRKAIPWLRENAARLTWDAAAKRWVLPKP